MAKQEKGWYPGAIKIPIPIFPDANARGGYGDIPQGGMEAVAVVHHVIQGFASTLNNWMQTGGGPQISCHFTIARDGTVFQYASVFDATWHAGDVEKTPQWELYDGVNPNMRTIGLEMEGFSAQVSYADYVYNDNNPWPEKMTQSVIDVTRWALEQHGIKASPDTVIGHFMLNSQNRKHDPGDAWPIQRILDELRGYKKIEKPDDAGQKDRHGNINEHDANLELAEQKLLAAIQLIKSAKKAD